MPAPRDDRVPFAVALAVFIGHLVIVPPYGFFRDELYFIDCGRHPAFGYVDQPPLVPLLAAATQALGHCLPLLRALAGLAHAGLVLVTAALARVVAEDAGAPRRPAGRLAAAAVALAPMFWGLHSTLNTTTFEPLAWTAIAWGVARATLRERPRDLVWVGFVAGVALEAKYALPFFLAPLAVGVALGPTRRTLFTRQAALSALGLVALALPSVLWQLAHGLPFLELLRAASEWKNVAVAPLAFAANQLLVMNLFLAPLWLGGVVFALGAPRLRFLAIAFVGVFFEMMLTHGKDYYVAPAYGVAFALGAAAVAKHVPWIWARALGLSLAAAMMAAAAPTSMPILPPPALSRYVVATHSQPQAQEKNQNGAAIPQLHADMLGWPELEASVADVWRSLGPDDRADAVILTSNYGEAGAIDFFGAGDGLPRARSGHNQLWLWGPGERDPRVVIVVNGAEERWRARCDEVTVHARFGGPYVMPYERDRPILLCRGLHISLRALWPALKHYD